MSSKTLNIRNIALLVFGGAMFLYSCSDEIPKTTLANNTPTISMDSLEMRYSENGLLSYYFKAARMDRYETKDSIYIRFNEGVFVETFDDSTKLVTSTLTSNRAYYNETKKFWIITGNVIGVNVEDGKTLYTEELFWNQETKRIYSHVHSKVIDGDEIIVGRNGFRANDDLSDITLLGSSGTIILDTTKNENSSQKDSLILDTTKKTNTKLKKMANLKTLGTMASPKVINKP